MTALVGDNGAGKSTLVRILAGIERPDDGVISVDGQPVNFTSPASVRQHGIETVYQDLALAPHLDLPANLYLGREQRRNGLLGRLGVLDRRAMRTGTKQALDQLGTTVPDLDAPVTQLSGGQRQAIAVLRAIQWARRAILLDEPTAALGANQTRRVLDLARRAAEGGTAVLIISHDLPEVLEVADRVTVLRQGRTIAELDGARTTPADLLDIMMGIDHHNRAADTATQPPAIPESSTAETSPTTSMCSTT